MKFPFFRKRKKDQRSSFTQIPNLYPELERTLSPAYDSRERSGRQPQRTLGRETTLPLRREPTLPSSTFWEATPDGSSSSAYSVPRFEPDDIIIGVMGMTGAGKSTFISNCAGIALGIGHGLSSCTKQVGVISTVIGGRRVHLIDTPGFDDTDLQDADILQVIALYLTNTQVQPIRLSGIIYLHNISGKRVGGTARKNIKMFRGLIGDSCMENVLLISNMWSEVNKADGQRREQELLDTDFFWGSLVRAGAKIDRYNNTTKDACRLVKVLMENVPRRIQLQREMDDGVKLEHTTAGREVADRIAEMEAQHRKDMEELREELRQERDDRAREQIQIQMDKTKEAMEEVAAAREMLQQDVIDELRQQIYQLQNRSRCMVM